MEIKSFVKDDFVGYEITVRFMHGDDDGTTEQVFRFENVDDFKLAYKFYDSLYRFLLWEHGKKPFEKFYYDAEDKSNYIDDYEMNGEDTSLNEIYLRELANTDKCPFTEKELHDIWNMIFSGDIWIPDDLIVAMVIRGLAIPIEVSEARFFDGTNVYKVNMEDDNGN